MKLQKISTSKTFQVYQTSEVHKEVKRSIQNMGFNVNQFKLIRQEKKHIMRYTLDRPMNLNQDILIPEILVINSHKPGTALRFQVGFYRMICSNGLIVGNTTFQERITHRITKKRDLNDIEIEIPFKIAACLDYIKNEAFKQFEKAIEIKTTPTNIIPIIKACNLPKKTFKKVCKQLVNNDIPEYDNTKTVYGLYNMINETLRKNTRSEMSRFNKNNNLLENMLKAA